MKFHVMKTRFPLLLLCLALLLLPALQAGALSVQVDKNDLSRNEALPSGIRTILLLLFDAPQGEQYGPSETMMLATVDSSTGDAKMTLLQAQLLVDIPGVGQAPLSMAYALGGENLAMKTVNETFGLNIKDCIAFNMITFSSLVDTVGDIRLDLTEADAAALGLSPGENALNAEQVLTYMRLPGDDPAQNRQYQVYRQALYQGTRDRSPSRLFSVMNKVLESMYYNISVFDLMGMGTAVLGGGNQEELVLPDPSTLVPTEFEGQRAYTTDLDVARTALHAFLYP